MRKAILANGLTAVFGLALDLYGIFNLSLPVAIVGFSIGVTDIIVYVWLIKSRKV